MGEAPQLTAFEKWQFFGYLDEKKSVREIANKLKHSKDIIYNFLKYPEGYGKNYVAGRPSKLTSRDLRTLIKMACKGESSSNELKEMLKLPVSARTVRHHLSSTTYLKYEKCNKAPMVKILHKENRFEWAKEMVSYGGKWTK